MNKAEILSPAGNITSFIAAVNAGADAVYMGLNEFNARSMAQNFTFDEYIWCIAEAHKRNVKVYLTLNVLLKDNEIKKAVERVGKLYEYGLDAVIVQDIGLAYALHKVLPDLPLHASTQMSVYSIEQIEFLEQIGFKRVVLARELSLEEIQYICSNTQIEIEVFVHGALCVCVSGQCNMSRLIGERSANRGSCAQPCRMKYSLYKVNQKQAIVENKYILSKKDIWGLDYVKQLEKIGVTSLKIEGRNRSAEYVAKATTMYKEALEKGYLKEQENELLQLFNRSGKCTGYFTGVLKKESISENTPKNTGLKLGTVLLKNNQFIKVKLEEPIEMHDGIEIYNKDTTISTIVTCIKNDNFKVVNEKVEKGNYVWLGDIKGKCEIGSTIYKTSSNSLNDLLKLKYCTKLTKQLEHKIGIKVLNNENISVLVKDLDVLYKTTEKPEKSKTKSTTESDILNAFCKTQDTSAKFKIDSIELDNDVFVSTSKLNAIRREVVSLIEEKMCAKRKWEKKELEEAKIKKSDKVKYNSLYIYEFDKNKEYITEYYRKYNKKLNRVYIPINLFITEEKEIFNKFKGVDVYLAIPNVVFKKLNAYVLGNIERLVKNGVKGILLGSFQYIKLVSSLKAKYNISVIADYSLNISNKYTIEFLQNNMIDEVTLSIELNEEELKDFMCYGNAELFENLATAMTSRYCILGSFVSEDEVCKKECMKSKYYIVDLFDKRYDIVTEPIDCIMRLVRNKARYSEKIESVFNIRNVWLN